MINKLIIDSLKPLNIPVSLLKYTGSSDEYIVFQEYLQQSEGFSEDDEELTGHYIQLNLFTKGDNTSLVQQTKELLNNSGFKRQNEYDLFDNETGFYNHVFRYFYLEQI
jgi:hypothetical protein